MSLDLEQLILTPEKPIVKALMKKKELLEQRNPAHEEIRPLLIILGGGMRGVAGGGAVCGLNLLGLNNVFDVAIGASAGAPIAAYFLAGTEQSYLGTSIFYDELREKKFINPFNVKEVANIEWLHKSFIEGSKKLDIKALFENRTQLYIALTDYIDGTTDLFNTREYPQQVAKMLAISSAIPVLYRRRLVFDGRRYLDGTVAFSVRRTLDSPLIKELNPTDVLLITNFEEGMIRDVKTKSVERFAQYFSHHFERLLLRRIQLQDDLSYLSSISSPRIGVLTGADIQDAVGQLTTDYKKLHELGDTTLQQTLKSFGRPELYKPLNAPIVS